MSDNFSGVTAAYNAPSYTAGQTITVTISGEAVKTNTATGQAGPLTLTITAADGSTTTIAVPSVPVTTTTTANESVVISAVQDTGTPARTWTIATGGLSASATA